MQARLSFVILLVHLAPIGAFAQTDIVVRPDPVGTSLTRAQTNALGGGLETCLVLDVPADGTFHLDPANHFECLPATTGGVTEHTITVPEGDGAVTVRAVTRRTGADGAVIVSAESPNFKKVLDVPGRPEIMSGHPALADDLA